ncbi:hypothetical protein NKG94_50065 [Micromonospora sp. M12]
MSASGPSWRARRRCRTPPSHRPSMRCRPGNAPTSSRRVSPAAVGRCPGRRLAIHRPRPSTGHHTSHRPGQQWHHVSGRRPGELTGARGATPAVDPGRHAAGTRGAGTSLGQPHDPGTPDRATAR